MLVKIENDAFNIAERIKKINPHYFVVYNTERHVFEVHNSRQYSSSFCITCDLGLNYSVISKLRKTKIENLDKIMREIDENNEQIDAEVKRIERDKATFKAREMFQYAKQNDDCDYADCYTTRWC
ncbi:MAG: hypothetical protein IKQ31_02875 [Clostridia bacterium]|nr:hypothetical protein [Clostridia bacterium]